MASFQIDVVSPEATVWSGQAEFVVARTVDGEIGIMADHEPVMAALATGAVKIESGDETVTIGVHGGFLQVFRNAVTLLTDRAELVDGGVDDAQLRAEELRESEADSDVE